MLRRLTLAYDYDLVCIGSGPAGQRAAVQAAKFGKRVAVVEKRRIVGGVCVETGTIPSKTFREAVLSLDPPENPLDPRAERMSPPTAKELLARVNEVIRREGFIVRTQLERNGVEAIYGEARFSDPHTLQVESERGTQTLSAANILIAVGTRPAPPPGIDTDGRLVMTSDHVPQMQELPRNLAVVGAGVVGIEYASIFGVLTGVEVILVDQRTRPLEFLDGEIVDELIHQMRSHEVSLRLGEAVERVEITKGPPERVVMWLESGKRVVSDAVLFSTGRTGSTDRLDLASAGLETDSRGRIKVDEQFRTVVPHIFAAGDVIGFPSLAATASEQGRLAACHAFGVDIEPMGEHFPIGIYSIPEISMTGETEEELTGRKIPYEIGIGRYRETARGQILGDDSGLLKMLFHREDRKLLGVHIIGTSASELIHIGQAVLRLGGGLDYFLNTVFNYPTLAECYKVAALDAHNKLVM
ncbi:MAG: Si-specific NAD(P)(+) transhydrogenase [Candidatus Eisenbacteria bacterium]|nr:Si-specific NAD(P)(+) transhydrogenase [Candidatus Eisenbacteria bacterium]